MKYSDIAQLSELDIQKKIREIKESLFDIKMKNSMGQVQNAMAIRYQRRDIAKLKTALTVRLSGGKNG